MNAWIVPTVGFACIVLIGYVQMRFARALRQQEEVLDDLTARARVPFPTRPRRGACPDCGAADDEWCREHCRFTDLTDHR